MNNKGNRKFLGLPQTRLGWWSIGCAAIFVLLFMLWLLYLKATPMERPTFFSDPLHAVLILGAAVSAISGAIVGTMAFLVKHERSLLPLLSIIVGGFVLYWTIAELIGH